MAKRGEELAKLFIKFSSQSNDQQMGIETVNAMIKDFHNTLNDEEQDQFLSFIESHIAMNK